MTGRDWFFVQISDLQFGMMRPGAEDCAETPLVRRAVEAINAMRPDFVLNTGDIVDQPGSERQLSLAESLLSGLDPAIPVLTVPGNHDVGDAPTPETLAWFRRRVGRDRFAFAHRGWRFIGLNSCLLADGSQAPGEAAEQWQWFEAELARGAGGAGIIVFMHHPPFLERPDEPDGYFNLPREPRRRLLDLLRAHWVPLLLTGHLHHCHETAHGVTRLVTTGPVGMPLGDGVSGLRRIDMAEGLFQARYLALEDASAPPA